MRKTNVFIAVTTAALAAAGMSVPATESKAKTDAYLIVDLAKVSEPVEETVTEAESLAEIGENELAIESSAEELLTNFYLDLSYLEDTRIIYRKRYVCRGTNHGTVSVTGGIA